MHALSHSLAHRAPPATRPRVRWQPYSSLPCSISSRSPPVSYLNTPASSVTSSPTSSLSVCEFERHRPSLALGLQTPKDSQLRDTQKNKYVLGLVDQAVKSLCEIWHPQDIPSVFLTSSRSTVTDLAQDPVSSLISKNKSFLSRNTQLPSPVSPSTRPSPESPSSAASAVSSKSTDSHSRSNLVPIKGFVHEVLRRSRTSGSVLQTALCYLEAIRPKVPELVRRERLGIGTQVEPDLSILIVRGEDGPDDSMNLDVNNNNADGYISHSKDDKSTITANSIGKAFRAAPPPSKPTAASLEPSKRPKTPSPPLQPLPPLPSPLLCPRRAFLASLILASKFTQDKCYSNRAWAKLSGLPPREIGRCERALGDALEWRLWVGKQPIPLASPTTPRANGSGVVRSQSDGDLFGSKYDAGWSVKPPPSVSSDPGHPYGSSMKRSQSGLRRCSTLPSLESSDRPSTSATIPISDSSHDSVTMESSMCMTPMCASSTTIHHLVRQQTYYAENLSPSPTGSTPTLVSSPSSTESSVGERTIQMTSFIDESMILPGKNSCFPAIPNGRSKLSSPMTGVGSFSQESAYAPVNPTICSENGLQDRLIQPYTMESITTLYSY